jgi:acyl-CoA thioester hydrolase
MISLTDDIIQKFKHKTDIQIRFKDLDNLNHVNNANHLTYFEISRIKYFKDVFRGENKWKEYSVIMANTEITYKIPIYLQDEISCYTRVSRIGNKSFDVENIIVKKENDKFLTCAFGKSVLVCLNKIISETAKLPTEWVNSIKTFEGI